MINHFQVPRKYPLRANPDWNTVSVSLMHALAGKIPNQSSRCSQMLSLKDERS